MRWMPAAASTTASKEPSDSLRSRVSRLPLKFSIATSGRKCLSCAALLRLLVPTLAKPDLVIYIQARPEVLLSRVRKRGIGYERNISLDYLKTLSDAYNEYFFHYNETPLLIVNTSEIDFVESARDLEHLVREVKSVKRGMQHYIPLGSR